MCGCADFFTKKIPEREAMRSIYILPFFVLFLLSCKTKYSLVIKADITNGLRPGSCYFSIITDEGTQKESPFIIEIVPPKYEMTYVKYSDINLEQHRIEGGKYQFVTSHLHLKFVINERLKLSDFTIINNPSGYMYCMVESPTQYLTITKEQLTERNNKIPIKKLVRHSMVIKTHVKKKPKKLKENQYFFETNYWTKTRVAGEG